MALLLARGPLDVGWEVESAPGGPTTDPPVTAATRQVKSIENTLVLPSVKASGCPGRWTWGQEANNSAERKSYEPI